MDASAPICPQLTLLNPLKQPPTYRLPVPLPGPTTTPESLLPVASGPDATQSFSAKLEDPQRWKIVQGVPIFKAHERTDPASGQLIKVDLPKLYRIASNMQKLERQGGVPIRCTLGHTEPNKPEPEQPPVCGYYKNARVQSFGPKGEPAVVVDEWLDPQYVPVRKNYPYRSAEYYDDAEQITGVALLTRDPYLDLGVVAYERGDALVCYTKASKPDRRTNYSRSHGRSPILYHLVLGESPVFYGNHYSNYEDPDDGLFGSEQDDQDGQDYQAYSAYGTPYGNWGAAAEQAFRGGSLGAKLGKGKWGKIAGGLGGAIAGGIRGYNTPEAGGAAPAPQQVPASRAASPQQAPASPLPSTFPTSVPERVRVRQPESQRMVFKGKDGRLQKAPPSYTYVDASDADDDFRLEMSDSETPDLDTMEPSRSSRYGNLGYRQSQLGHRHSSAGAIYSDLGERMPMRRYDDEGGVSASGTLGGAAGGATLGMMAGGPVGAAIGGLGGAAAGALMGSRYAQNRYGRRPGRYADDMGGPPPQGPQGGPGGPPPGGQGGEDPLQQLQMLLMAAVELLGQMTGGGGGPGGPPPGGPGGPPPGGPGGPPPGGPGGPDEQYSRYAAYRRRMAGYGRNPNRYATPRTPTPYGASARTLSGRPVGESLELAKVNYQLQQQGQVIKMLAYERDTADTNECVAKIQRLADMGYAVTEYEIGELKAKPRDQREGYLNHIMTVYQKIGTEAMPQVMGDPTPSGPDMNAGRPASKDEMEAALKLAANDPTNPLAYNRALEQIRYGRQNGGSQYAVPANRIANYPTPEMTASGEWTPGTQPGFVPANPYGDSPLNG